MSKPIGVTIHHDDQSVLKVPIADLAAALTALQTAYQGTGSGRGKGNYLNSDTCPLHGPWSVQQGGVSKSTGRPYESFWKCDGKDDDGEFCKNRPSKAWVETHPPHMAGRSASSPEPAADPGEFDNLPF